MQNAFSLPFFVLLLSAVGGSMLHSTVDPMLNKPASFMGLEQPAPFVRPSTAPACHRVRPPSGIFIMSDAGSKLQPRDKDFDVFKDTGLRFLGYANEVGESFRLIVKRRFVRASYLISGGYVVADAGEKTIRAFNDHTEQKNRLVDAFDKGLDTLVWQGLASVAIPGLTINRIVWAASKIQWPGRLKLVAPTVIGLSSIPFIFQPIDEGVHILMDNTIRPAMHLLTAPLHAI